MTIIVPAAKIVQGDLVLYSTSLEVRDLVAPNFYSVEKLDPEDENNKGYQRLLNEGRAKKLANYIVKGQDQKDAFLPTSILLATERNIEQNESNNTITISSEEIGPFSVVDGQHRLEGLRMASEKDERILDFQVSINIAINLDSISQMCHFLIVNTTQKRVDKAVEQRIYARLTESINVEDIPSLPRWIKGIIDRGEVNKALKITDYLNSHPNSPWLGKIQMANDTQLGKTITQGSFVSLVTKYLLVANNPLTALGNFDQEKKILLNYWIAINDLLYDGSKSVLFKYNGVSFFSMFSIPFFMKLIDKKSFTIEKIKEELRNCFDSMGEEYAGVGHPEWWYSGNDASGMNAGAITRVVQEMTRALHRNNMREGIEL